MENMGYQIGDKIYIFGRDQDISEGVVENFTKTGRINVRCTGRNAIGEEWSHVRQFTAAGREIGGNSYWPPSIATKDEQDKIAAGRLKEQRRKIAIRKYRDACEEARTLDLRICCPVTIARGIEALDRAKELLNYIADRGA